MLVVVGGWGTCGRVKRVGSWGQSGGPAEGPQCPGICQSWATNPGVCSTLCLKTTHVCDRAWPGPLDGKPSPVLQAADALQPTLQPEMQLEHGAIQIQ